MITVCQQLLIILEQNVLALNRKRPTDVDIKPDIEPKRMKQMIITPLTKVIHTTPSKMKEISKMSYSDIPPFDENDYDILHKQRLHYAQLRLAKRQLQKREDMASVTDLNLFRKAISLAQQYDNVRIILCTIVNV
jgi:hypothetical protein